MSSPNTEPRQANDPSSTDGDGSLLQDILNSVEAETYFLASLVMLDNDQKRDFLQKALEKDPRHKSARRAIETIDSGEDDPSGLVAIPITGNRMP